ncbi:MAG: hypothetical protein KH452_13045 [Clostridiales bacterium]|nr:hypothetical protein [Clostridiales bacterium]
MTHKKRMQRWRILKRAVHMELREHRSSFLTYVILRLLVFCVMILQIINKNYESVFLCLLTLLLMIVPSLLQVTLRIELPTRLEILILVFIFAAEILGEIQKFYLVFPFWDTMLHTINGFLAAAIGLSLVELLNKSKNLTFRLSPFFTVVVGFCFSMTVGVLWEFFEFGMDMLFSLDMQKDTIIHSISSVMLNPSGENIPSKISSISEVSIHGKELGLGGYLDIGLLDTMKDLIVNFIGAAVFSFFGYFAIKRQNPQSALGDFIPRGKSDERDFLKLAETEQKKRSDKQERAAKSSD